MRTSDQHLQLSIVELTFFQLDKLPIKKKYFDDVRSITNDPFLLTKTFSYNHGLSC